MKHEQREAARHFRCPRCGADLGMFDSFQDVAPCSRCGWHRTDQRGAEAEPDKTSHSRWVNSVGLLILGAVSPLVVLIGMSVAIVAGPLALLLAPLAGILVGRMLCGFVYAKEGPRWFWYYVGAGLAVWLPVVGWICWGRHPVDNADNGWGGFALGLGMMMELGAVGSWLVGVVWTWLGACKQD